MTLLLVLTAVVVTTTVILGLRRLARLVAEDGYGTAPGPCSHPRDTFDPHRFGWDLWGPGGPLRQA